MINYTQLSQAREDSERRVEDAWARKERRQADARIVPHDLRGLPLQSPPAIMLDSNHAQTRISE